MENRHYLDFFPVLNADVPLDYFFPQCIVNSWCFCFVYGIFPPQLLLHFPRYLTVTQSFHTPMLYSRKEVIGTDRGCQTVSLQRERTTRLHRHKHACVLSHPSSRIWDSQIRWKNPRFWYYTDFDVTHRSGQPRCLQQKNLFVIALVVAWRRDCILWGNKVWINGWRPYFHPADKILVLWPHLKMNLTSVLMRRERDNKCCHLATEGVGPSMCCKGEQTLLVLKSMMPCSEVSLL